MRVPSDAGRIAMMRLHCIDIFSRAQFCVVSSCVANYGGLCFVAHNHVTDTQTRHGPRALRLLAVIIAPIASHQ